MIKAYENHPTLKTGLQWLQNKWISLSLAIYLGTAIHLLVWFAQPPEIVLIYTGLCFLTNTLLLYMFAITLKIESRIKSSESILKRVSETEFNLPILILLKRHQGFLSTSGDFWTCMLLNALSKHIQRDKPQIPLRRELKLAKILLLLQVQRLQGSMNIEIVNLFAGSLNNIKVPTGIITYCLAYIFAELLETKMSWPFLVVRGSTKEFRLTVSFNAISDTEFTEFKRFICAAKDKFYQGNSPKIVHRLIKKEKSTELLIELTR